MSLPEIQQAVSIIGRSSSLLLLVPGKPESDAFASMLACYLALLEHHSGTIDAVSPSHVPTHLQFLPGSSQIQMKPQIRPDVVIDIAGPEQVIEMRSTPLSGGIRIHVSLPAEFDVDKDNIETHVRKLPYDAVITFGTADLEALGELFVSQADFFYSTPIINIDHRPDNEYYGAVNLVDITASSVAEVTKDLIAALPDVEVSGNIATALYAGIVAATDSFQQPSTTPRAFKLAAELMDSDADKELVIQHLVKTKPLHLLKLSGRLYARLQHDKYGGLFWSILRPLDFTKAGATVEHIPDVMRELKNNISGFNAAFLLYEESGQNFAVYLLLSKGLTGRRDEIQEQLSAKRENGALVMQFSAASLEEAEKIALEKVRGILP